MRSTRTIVGPYARAVRPYNAPSPTQGSTHTGGTRHTTTASKTTDAEGEEEATSEREQGMPPARAVPYTLLVHAELAGPGITPFVLEANLVVEVLHVM